MSSATAMHWQVNKSVLATPKLSPGRDSTKVGIQGETKTHHKV